MINGATARKTYSTFFGLVLGFYFNGLNYIILILTFTMVYLILLIPMLSRKQKSWAANIFCLTVLLALHLKFWLRNLPLLEVDVSTHAMTIFVKTHMTLCSYTDALALINKDKKLA